MSSTPETEPDGCHELRVHGVAGSSPESMLGMQAVLTSIDSAVDVAPKAPPNDDGCGTDVRPGDISVWKPPAVQADLRAWSWSSLTSGHWYQAFYLILLPFMIANVAGWMLLSDRHPAAEETPTEPVSDEFRTGVLRTSTLLVRLMGLLVTVVFVLSVQLVLADLVVWQWLYRRLPTAHWVVGLGPAATALVLAGMVGLTRIRQPVTQTKQPWDDHRDPVGLGFLHRSQDLLWNSPGINVTLRRLHLTGGLATIALLAAWPAGALTDPWSTIRTIAFVLAILSGVLVVGLLSWISLGNGTTGLRPLMWFVRYVMWPIPAVGVAFAALAPLGLTTDATHSAPTLPALRGATLWVTAAVLIGAVALFFIGAIAGRSRKAVNTPTLLLVGASTGAALGAGLAGQVSRFLDGSLIIGDQVTWLAIGVTIGLAAFVLATTARALQLRRDTGWRAVIPRLTEGGTWITTVIGTVGVALAAIGVVTALVGHGRLPPASQFPSWLAWLVIAAVVVPVAVLVVWLALRTAWAVPDTDGSGRTRGPRRIIAVRTIRVSAVVGLTVAVAVVVPVAVAHGWTITVVGVALPPLTFPDFALDIAVVLPTAAALARIYSGLTNVTTRRGVGVLWDVGTFWPRWFHPFAPPTYSDRAVPRLAADLDNARHDVLLAPHSQGAIIAAAALLLGRPHPRLAMLSYGSPWNRLYAEFFPAQVNAYTTAALAQRLRTDATPRWINLYRVTDPIGGRIPGIPQDKPLPDPCHRVHSDYWLEHDYQVSAEQLRAMLP